MENKKTEFLIIGGGITGLTFANYSNGDYIIVEKENEVGGYCRTIKKKDFIWDYAGHFFHFKTEEFKKRFVDDLPTNSFVNKEKITYIDYKNSLIDYPFQMNIHQLEKEEFIDCLYDLFDKNEKAVYDNFLDMLYGKFGVSIVSKFLKPYNEKLYACDLKDLDKDAMGRFFPYADKESIIKNMKNSKDSSYNNSFLYPKSGAQTIIDILFKNLSSEKILLNKTIVKIDLEEKVAYLSDGETIKYNTLINTVPFDKFLLLINNSSYKKLSKKLTYNKVLVFNIGFNKKSDYNNQHWIYYPNKNINFYRVGFYDNILDSDKLSIYVEIGFSKDAKINVNSEYTKTLENLKKVGIIDESFLVEDYISLIMDPAYVHIDSKNDAVVRKTINELEKKNVYSIGRYGGWTYCSMEDSMLAAKNTAMKTKV